MVLAVEFGDGRRYSDVEGRDQVGTGAVYKSSVVDG